MSFRQAIVAEIPRLRRYARALTGDASRADDLVQDTLERALGKWRLWRPGNLRAWLFTLMHNIFVNQLQESVLVISLDGDTHLDVPVRPRQQDNLELRDLDRALARLSPEQREVLLLVGLEELSYEDTARVIGVPVGTVMSRLARARDKLRLLLAGDERALHLKVVK
ncbi:MAG TPA: sigma-70 family RNA polymerase sigma factor [Zoogloea sp.]|uniref:sigma-70 family RNA polymerase sigma factor n=1 Tax=Zoogloea sp. TaxID=49181 RepID=UPI002B699CFC|nr:sigma-70 family RNA polymerase sigma factor [Zoogloea sp.]HMV17322.1 sigma-70 family RNA polymerase sigma factor [Rhodocyclaceae bacterium]HMV62389.1 sigma-70 family RNA polymerase sigma factor [Rhodocyclaceae bacterium]HMW50980.1 sigma-70 family RNA polymerase sigma factor [Rhodocyclaceae bacterium]HMY49130.1 sigma-70 family RNA polymerase sigma factor [Rhodocyclaceae bacterium]HMZ75629.1 sigma-70 family RNA polymerase sigma factor [Rhodocyclaceae bacterium]